MEPQNGGLEDDVPFQLCDFSVPAVNFPGCRGKKGKVTFFSKGSKRIQHRGWAWRLRLEVTFVGL